MEGRRDSQVVFQFVPCTFLQEISVERIYRRDLNTYLETTSGIWFHDLAKVANELGERGADLAMLDDEGSRSIVGIVLGHLDMCSVFSPTCHNGMDDVVEKWRKFKK